MSRPITHGGRTLLLKEWASELGISVPALHRRLSLFPIEQALQPGRMRLGHAAAPIAERFWGKVDQSGGPAACWIWTAARSGNKYGNFCIPSPKPKRYVPAHRMAWELTNGPIPNGLFACHKCDNPPCVNPDHIFLGTVRDNSIDAYRKGRLRLRGPVGMGHPRCILTPDLVRGIRELRAHGFGMCIIAKITGSTYNAVRGVCAGITWKHVA